MGDLFMIQHKVLADGRWNKLSFIEQMAHAASEVERSLSWKKKGNGAYSQKASDRALELMDLTIEDPKNRRRLRELARVRELFVDYVYGENEYLSTGVSWRSYFSKFTYASRKDC